MRGGFGAHLWQVIIALDQLFNAVAGGWADETFSSRCWRRRAKPFWGRLRALVDKVFWTPGHCRASFESERARMHLAPEMREHDAFANQ